MRVLGDQFSHHRGIIVGSAAIAGLLASYALIPSARPSHMGPRPRDRSHNRRDQRRQHASRYLAEAQRLTAVVEAQAWDGEWYRRAYFDDGTPLGSRNNLEARIDSVAQSWGVISGAAENDRARQALQSVEDDLVRAQERMILLFTPPFAHSTLDPGYVKSYPPGVRENGGQYTHAAIWVALAFARRGDGDRATALLRLLNPVEHARTPEDVARYKVEPYVVSADVYALEGQLGRGGWTWYTGSSGWMYRVWIEEILGFRLRGSEVTIDPVLPHEWNGFSIRFSLPDGALHNRCRKSRRSQFRRPVG